MPLEALPDETLAQCIEAMLEQLVPAAVANARAEAEELSELAGYPVQAWDRAFWAERLRRERFAVDAAALRPYFELERVLHDGVFHAAGELYGLRFAERHDLPVQEVLAPVIAAAREIAGIERHTGRAAPSVIT